MSESQKIDRRSFLRSAGAAGIAAPFFVRNLISAPPSDTVRLASFGAGNMAFFTLDGIARHKNVKLIAIADVDSAMFAQAHKKYPDFKEYGDWRQLLDKERKNLDAACVGTPDHMHAPIAMSAMQRGLNVYVQKPLTHDIYEARKLAETARKKKLVTQMGIQIHSASEYRTAVQLVQSGTIGKIKEVHSWSNKKWGDPNPVPDRSDPVPPTLNWDQWIGIAATRPYIDGYYHPANWRKRIDFGTGTFGDMGCHIYDPVFEALALTAPISVRSEGPVPTQHNWAVNDVIHYVFPGTRYSEGKTVNITWYDGDAKPPEEVRALVNPQRRFPGQGSIFIGTKGVMLLPHVEMPTLYPREQFKDFAMPKLEPFNHYFQFVDAILGRTKTTTLFDYSGPLTETVLLGPIATRFPQTTLEWHASKMKFKNSKEATAYVRRKYRDGWKVKGLS